MEHAPSIALGSNDTFVNKSCLVFKRHNGRRIQVGSRMPSKGEGLVGIPQRKALRNNSGSIDGRNSFRLWNSKHVNSTRRSNGTELKL
jgi:hypothetical protein